MPTTTVFKNKWNVFITKLSPPSPLEHVHNQRRRRSSCSENNNNNGSTTRINEQFLKRRKHSDAMSVGTFDSTISIKDKFRQAIPFFRRRSSASHFEEQSQPQPHQQQHASPQQSQVTVDYYEQLERLQQLYTLAVDELNYAEDSQGSSYYSGDLITAREALDDCANTFMHLLTQITDVLTREGLQSSMTPKLLSLQKRLDALPEAGDTY